MKLKLILEDFEQKLKPKISLFKKAEIYFINKLFDDLFLMLENSEDSLKRIAFLFKKKGLSEELYALNDAYKNLYRLKEELNIAHNNLLKKYGKL